MMDIRKLEVIFRAVDVGSVWNALEPKFKKSRWSKILKTLEQEEKEVSNFIDQLNIDSAKKIYEGYNQTFLSINALNKTGDSLRVLRNNARWNFKRSLGQESSFHFHLYKSLNACRYALRYSINQIKKELDI